MINLIEIAKAQCPIIIHVRIYMLTGVRVVVFHVSFLHSAKYFMSFLGAPVLDSSMTPNSFNTNSGK